MSTLIQIKLTLRARIDNCLRRKAFQFNSWDNKKISFIVQELLIDISSLYMDDLVNSDEKQQSH